MDSEEADGSSEEAEEVIDGGGEGSGGLAAWMARARWRVRAPCPVPASRISRGGSGFGGGVGGGGSTWMSRRLTMMFASDG